MLEKFGMVGGTTAMSGGMLWIPLNDQQAEHGVEDSFDEIVAYLDGLARVELDPETVGAFLDGGPGDAALLRRHTPVRLGSSPASPTTSRTPWAARSMAAGRSTPRPSRSRSSARWPVGQPAEGRLAATHQHDRGLLRPEAHRRRSSPTARRATSAARARRSSARCSRAVIDRDIPIRLRVAGPHPVRDGARVVGVVTEQDGTTLRFGARKGVVIATGGFEWNEQLVKSFLRGPMTGRSACPSARATACSWRWRSAPASATWASAWWMMSSQEMAAHGRGNANFLIGHSERTLPGSIMVNRAAKRFVNEAANYNAIGPVLHNFDANTYEFVEPAVLADLRQPLRREVPVLHQPPGDPVAPWAIERRHARGARQQPSGRRRRAGRHRRAVQHDGPRRPRRRLRPRRLHLRQLLGRPGLRGALPTLGAIDQPPYYAIKMEAGVLGTCGGPRPNADAQVLDWNDKPIDGLYVCSNTMAAADRGGLRRRRRHDRPGHDLRLPRRAARRAEGLTDPGPGCARAGWPRASPCA